MLTSATCIDKDRLRYWKGKVDDSQNKKGVLNSTTLTFGSFLQYDVEDVGAKISEKGAICGF
jgi:hypothetical protein